MKRLTVQEALQALATGGKLRIPAWPKKHFITINSEGLLVGQDDISFDTNDFKDYVLYKEPKPKTKVWQWRVNNKVSVGWHLSVELLTEKQAKIYFKDSVRYEKFGEAIEVEQ